MVGLIKPQAGVVDRGNGSGVEFASDMLLIRELAALTYQSPGGLSI
jgi:hypothetical protein